MKDLIGEPKDDKLLSCAAGGHTFCISPEGKMFICSILRKPEYDLLKEESTVKDGFYTINEEVHGKCFNSESKCRRCEYRMICKWCPGRAYLEKGNLEESIEYFCQLTREVVREYANRTGFF